MMHLMYSELLICRLFSHDRTAVLGQTAQELTLQGLKVYRLTTQGLIVQGVTVHRLTLEGPTLQRKTVKKLTVQSKTDRAETDCDRD